MRMLRGMAERQARAAFGAAADRWVGACLALSGALLAAGLFLPALTLSRFFFTQELSLAAAVFAFARGGDWLLFAATFVFTIAFPLGKVAVCLALWYGVPARGGAWAERLAGWLSALSRWSMVDVFILALVVLVVDGQLLTSADLHAGVVVFAAGVLLSTWAARRTAALAPARRAA